MTDPSPARPGMANRATDDGATAIVAIVGVYHADGGPIGEARYVLGKLLGTAHCALCDLTHSPVRRKPEWDAMVARLGVPVTLLHLNEMAADVAAMVREHGSPALFGRTRDGSLLLVIDSAGLEVLGGSVPRLESVLHSSLERGRWILADR